MLRRVRLWVGIIVAAAMTVAWVLPAAAGSSTAATNLVANPSGAGGSTADWGTGRSVDSLSAVQVGGQWWLHWSTPQAAYDWVVYKFPPTAVTAGTEYACGFEAMGSGTIYAMLYDGKNLNRGTALKLTDTPQVFTESAKAVNPSGPVEIQARINAGPANVYFNEVTCVAGSTVTIPVEAVSLSTSPAGSNTSSSSKTSSNTPAAPGPTPAQLAAQAEAMRAFQRELLLDSSSYDPIMNPTSGTASGVDLAVLEMEASKVPATGLRYQAIEREIGAIKEAFPGSVPSSLSGLTLSAVSPGGQPIFVLQDGTGTSSSPINIGALWTAAVGGNIGAAIELAALGLVGPWKL